MVTRGKNMNEKDQDVHIFFGLLSIYFWEIPA
jgi:hypothetical protein